MEQGKKKWDIPSALSLDGWYCTPHTRKQDQLFLITA